MPGFKEGNPDKPCCGGGCPVYKFDFETAVSSADWTVDVGSVTFHANSIDLGPGAKITLNSVSLAGNNYAASLEVSASNTTDDLQLHLGDASTRIDWSSGAYTITLNNGSVDKAEVGTDATKVNPALGICLNGTALTGWSGWTYRDGPEGYGHTRATYSGTLAGSLSIENHGAASVTLSSLTLTQAMLGDVYDGVMCADCEPSIGCAACDNGWIPTSVKFTISNRQSGAKPCYSTYDEAKAASGDCGALPRDDHVETIVDGDGNCILGGLVASVSLLAEGTSAGDAVFAGSGCWQHDCSAAVRVSNLHLIQINYAADPMVIRIKVDESTYDDHTEYYLEYVIGSDECFSNLSITIADFYESSRNTTMGNELSLSAEALAIQLDIEPTL